MCPGGSGAIGALPSTTDTHGFKIVGEVFDGDPALPSFFQEGRVGTRFFVSGCRKPGHIFRPARHATVLAPAGPPVSLGASGFPNGTRLENLQGTTPAVEACHGALEIELPPHSAAIYR